MPGHGALLDVRGVRRAEEEFHGRGRRCAIVLVHQRHEAAAEQLVLGLAEHLAVAGADVDEPAFEVDLDHHVALVLHQELVFGPALAQRFLATQQGLQKPRDARDQHQAAEGQESTRAGAEVRRGCGGRRQTQQPWSIDEAHRQAGRHRPRLRQIPRRIGVRHRAVLGQDDHVEALTQFGFG